MEGHLPKSLSVSCGSLWSQWQFDCISESVLVNPLLNLFFLAQPGAFPKIICQHRLNPNQTGQKRSWKMCRRLRKSFWVFFFFNMVLSCVLWKSKFICKLYLVMRACTVFEHISSRVHLRGYKMQYIWFAISSWLW